jgi:hypothetical protein
MKKANNHTNPLNTSQLQWLSEIYYERKMDNHLPIPIHYDTLTADMSACTIIQ